MIPSVGDTPKGVLQEINMIVINAAKSLTTFLKNADAKNECSASDLVSLWLSENGFANYLGLVMSRERLIEVLCLNSALLFAACKCDLVIIDAEIRRMIEPKWFEAIGSKYKLSK